MRVENDRTERDIFNCISEYVVYDRQKVIDEIQVAKRCYFYDTCMLRNHIKMLHPEWFFEYIKKTAGIVIITKGILIEMGVLKEEANGKDLDSESLDREYIEYIKKMNEYGIKILILYEEDIFYILSEVFSTIARINELLAIAIKVVKRMTGTIHKTLMENDDLMDDIFYSNNFTDKEVFSRFFMSVRHNKEQGDNLGEELLAICVHLLANIPDDSNYKYIILTDDKGAIGLINKTRKNSEQYVEEKKISVYSTAKLAQRMYINNIITYESQVGEFLATGLNDNMIRIRGSEEYDLCDEVKIMLYDELARKITIQGAIHINY